MWNAWLELVFVDPGAKVHNLGVGEGLALTPGRRYTVGKAITCDVICQAIHQGGRINCLIEHIEGSWWLSHAGHSEPIWVNDKPLPRGRHRLLDGDTYKPGPGIVFRFRERPAEGSAFTGG